MQWPFRGKKKRTQKEKRKESAEAREKSTSAEDLACPPYMVTDTLDLHGFFPQQVPPMIRDFIDNARSLKLRRLRIVHGKGKSRLKWEVRQALKTSPVVGELRWSC
jgi:DNA-nicking Smr family endonuclease